MFRPWTFWVPQRQSLLACVQIVFTFASSLPSAVPLFFCASSHLQTRPSRGTPGYPFSPVPVIGKLLIQKEKNNLSRGAQDYIKPSAAV